MPHTFKTILFFLLFNSAFNIYGQDSDWEIFNTSNSSLPGNNITDIEFDIEGNVWISTEDNGLCKYDGQTWTVFNASNYGTPLERVNSIEIDKNNNIWIGTWGNGIIKYDGTGWTIFNTSNSEIPTRLIYMLKIDRNNILWGGGYGLTKYDGSNWTFYNKNNSELLANGISDIKVDKNNFLWLTTDIGLYRFDGNNFVLYNSEEIPNNYFLSLFIEENGNKWIGLRDGVLVSFYNNLWEVYNSENSPIPSADILEIYVDNKGKKWIGTRDGLVINANNNWSILNTDNSPLPSNKIQAIKQSPIGEKWIGTPKGIAVFKRDGKFEFIPKSKSYGFGPIILGNNEKRSIIFNNIGTDDVFISQIKITGEDSKEFNFINNFSNYIPVGDSLLLEIEYKPKNTGIHEGIVILEYQNYYKSDTLFIGGICAHKNEWVVFNQANSDLPANNIRDIAFDPFGNKWIATYKGVVKFNNYQMHIYDKDNSGLLMDMTNCILIDKNNTVWVGAGAYGFYHKGGLFKFDGKNWVIPFGKYQFQYVTSVDIDKLGNIWIGAAPVRFCEEDGGLGKITDSTKTIYNKFNYITSLRIDEDGVVWCGVAKEGLIKFNEEKWEKFTIPNYYSQWGVYISSIAIDKNDNKWLALFTGGIAVYNDKDSIWTRYTKYNSDLLSDRVKSITIDGKDRKWIGTFDAGLMVFDNHVWSVYNTFDSEIPSNSINEIKIDKFGNVWVATGDAGFAILVGATSPITNINNHKNKKVLSNLLYNNFPNPFNSYTKIKYFVPALGNVKLMVFNLLGQKVRMLVNEIKKPGKYSTIWDGNNDNGKPASSGIYILQLKCKDKVEQKKMIFLR